MNDLHKNETCPFCVFKRAHACPFTNGQKPIIGHSMNVHVEHHDPSYKKAYVN